MVPEAKKFTGESSVYNRWGTTIPSHHDQGEYIRGRAHGSGMESF